ncbi:uncharacterized protein K489DRAFT_376311 [Dissoconium aciculare CBS 342.82]|uniref:Uncharacterized protein n=1 Tax=Dissoconium aciculare CBS 342.82 TaxID=1314786 RepID=A0A6J3MGA2_9PEZI|nr:uncharacterized protein K489DRAFT_376311 [Dissoconium aciculare CBS 342.82]KAF1825922.1 hypothetical protein K489DRAFT_376311 [Dissoconium aciculare CBS 342.82]
MFCKQLRHILLQLLLINSVFCAPKASSGKTCALGNNPSPKRLSVRHDDSASISSRTGLSKQPLQNPATTSQENFETFMASMIDESTRTRNGERVNTLFREPSNEEIAAFTIAYQGSNFHSGTTGFYYEFGSKKNDFYITGLHGCTAVVIVSPRGIWGLHIWETESGPDRAGGFRKLTGTPLKEVSRSDAEFQAIAVDIIGQATPANLRARRPKWKSLSDVKNNHGDPFGTGADSTVFLFTPALSESDPGQRFATKVAMIVRKIRDLLPNVSRTNFIQKTYVAENRAIKEVIQGTILVQYTPYERDSDPKNKSPQARARLFIENQKKPIYDKYMAPPV